jgi:hypothetical protein
LYVDLSCLYQFRSELNILTPLSVRLLIIYWPFSLS